MGRDSFEEDEFPGKPRILFVGPGDSSHVHSWIDLLKDTDFNVRLFAVPRFGDPPMDWKVKTYLASYHSKQNDSPLRRRLFGTSKPTQMAQSALLRLRGLSGADFAREQLAIIIRKWRPDIIHTLGLRAAGIFYHIARRQHDLAGIGIWVQQLRGPSDLYYTRKDPVEGPILAAALQDCDQLLSDNTRDFEWAVEMGMPRTSISSIGTISGTGGIDVEALSSDWNLRPSQRRIIICPKMTNSEWSKATPIVDAITMAWSKIAPCEIHFLVTAEDVELSLKNLPQEIRSAIRVRERIPRSQVLQLLKATRVMLAPSIVDGVPNSMLEAMASGALPIVSPLETITPLVRNETNVLFAANDSAEEIAVALDRAMNDDALVEEAAKHNGAQVRRIADREVLRPRVITYYRQLAAHGVPA